MSRYSEKPYWLRFRFEYAEGGYVTVKGRTYEEGRARAVAELDLRYERADREPPVAWTLTLLSAIPVKQP